MLRKGWLAKELRTQVFEIRYYNRYGKQDMIHRNIGALKILSAGDLIISIIFFTTSKWVATGLILTWHYWLLIPTFFAFAMFSFIYGEKEQKSYCVVRTSAILFSCLLVALIANIGIFSDPNRPDILMSFLLVLMPLFFSVETWVVATIVILGGCGYSILADIFKDPSVTQHDIFVIVLSMVMSMLVLAYSARLRAISFIAIEKYKKLSRTDLLTGILNKRSYELWCQKLIYECENNGPCALAIFDIDNFKQVNDTYGHIIGDKVLEIVGRTLSSVFGSDGLVGRIGGDEFGAFVYTRGGCDMLGRRAENVVAEVRERSRKELKIDVAISMGISTKIGCRINYMEMYFDADMALYEFKRAALKESCTLSV
ncbi:MAG: GGDEF domain-containing protein [Clostridia bacterium]|nr:GGDEF domain-containing protein [Clostridia bacterium]